MRARGAGTRGTKRESDRSGAPARQLAGARRCRGVLLIRHVLAPGDGAAGLVVLLHCEMSHEAVGRGAMPVVLAGLEEHAVTGPDLLNRSALSLAQPDALRNEDRLTVGMGVPGRPGAGREVHERGAKRRAPRGSSDGVDV